MKHMAIGGVSPVAVEAAARIGAQGGNAIDATVAASLVSLISEPGVVALGAGGYLTIWPSEGRPVTVDGYVAMPGKGLDPERIGKAMEPVFMDYGGGLTTMVGHGSVGIPGAIAACGTAIEHFGRLPWAAVVEPALDAARDGFPLSTAAHRYLETCHDTIFARDPIGYAALHDNNGNLLPVGTMLRIPGLADTMRSLAQEGPSTFYTGKIAEIIVEDMRTHGGLITREDFAGYRALIRSPLTVESGPWTVATNPPPAVGGAAVVALLLEMEAFPRHRWDEEALRRLIEAQDEVFSYRRVHLDMADDMDEAVTVFLSAIRARVGSSRSSSTIHTSVVDEDGLGCAATFSAGYGSGIVPPGTGFWMNNSLGEAELNPRGVGSVVAGERLLSNMAPTVARRSDGATIAIGSPGADRITTAVLQAFLNITRLQMGLQAAIAHPRLHVEHSDGAPVVAYEPGLDVEDLGYATRRFDGLDMFFGGVAAAARMQDGTLDAGGDPRRDGVGLVL